MRISRSRPPHPSVLAAGALLVLGTACAPPAATTLPQPAGPAIDAACALPHTRIGDVQGSGPATPLAGQPVTVQGTVVADYEGSMPALGGFYVQDSGDGNAATSDGIFISNAGRDDVRAGDVVRVAGSAGEEREQTQIAASTIVHCGTGTVTPHDVTLPLPTMDGLERFEGMLVRLPQTLYLTEHYQLGRYGEIVVSSGGRLPQPTLVAEPGDPARAVQAANDLNRITLDDASWAQNPADVMHARGTEPLSPDNTLRGGDHVTGYTGVMTQTSASGGTGGITYRLRPATTRHPFTAGNPRIPPAQPADGTLRIASFNVLNYFNTFTGCTGGVDGSPADCRGAEDAAEFERQWQKTVAAVLSLDADVVGILELENDGYGDGSAIAHLVERLNEGGTPEPYAFIHADSATGTRDVLGTDAIRVALLYRPGAVQPVGRTAVLNSAAFVNAGESAERNRPSLVQAFREAGGGTVIVSVNHLKSKGSECDVPDARDGQGNCNAARTTAARHLVDWLATDPTGTGDPDILVMGDLNAYTREDPIRVFTSRGYMDLIGAHAGGLAYSYVFNGQWGYLDHALATPSLARQVSAATEWHINADEPSIFDYNRNFRSPAQQSGLYRPDPFRSSDHDPVLVDLRLGTR